MKRNRIVSFTIVMLAMAIVLGQWVGGKVQAAPGNYKVEGRMQVQVVGNAQAADKPIAPNQPSDQAAYHITIQGRLMNGSGGPLPAGNYNMTFNAYQTAAGGSSYYTDGPTAVMVNEGGLFTYLLGTANPITLLNTQLFAGKLYVGVKVNGDPEMTPRFEFTAAPYSLSLSAGAVVRGSILQQTQPWYGVINGVNDDTNDAKSAGVFGQGAAGVYGKSARGVGVRGESNGNLPFEQGAGIVGINNDVSNSGIAAAGIFTAAGPGGWGVLAYGGSGGNGISGHAVEGFNNNANAVGVGGNATGDNGYGVYGSGYDLIRRAPGSNSAIGGQFNSYDNGTGNLGLQVIGYTFSVGGYVGGMYSIATIYNGNGELRPGDLVALDGNNTAVLDADILGTVKATSPDAPIVGVVTHRYRMVNAPAQTPDLIMPRFLLDDKATSFRTGDYLQVTIMGAVRLPLKQTAAIGTRLTLASDGSLTPLAVKSPAPSYGMVASQPDAQGNTLVYVNFKLH